MDELKSDPCDRIRPSLPAYLRGHVFPLKRKRIERHLAECIMCRTECEAIRHADGTRHILRQLDAPEGLAGRVHHALAALDRMRSVVYRPVWMALIGLALVGVMYAMLKPPQLAVEIDKIEKGGPSAASRPSITAGAPQSAITATAMVVPVDAAAKGRPGGNK